MKTSRSVGEISYQRVLLAIYYLAEPDGLFCYATNRDLATSARLSTTTVRRAVHRMVAVGDVFIPQKPRRSSSRALVLTDHPNFKFYLQWWDNYWGPLYTQCLLNKAARESAEAEIHEAREQEPIGGDSPDVGGIVPNQAARWPWPLCQN